MNTHRWFGLFLLLFVLGCSNKGPDSKSDLGPPEVTVAHPAVEKLTETTDLTGALDAVEYVQVRPRVSGYIKEVKFKDGDSVKEGDELVLIDPAPYKAAWEMADGQLKNYKAQLRLAEAELARNQKLVTTGGISREEYDKSFAQKEVAAANIGTAQASLDRAKLDLDWTRVTAPINGKTDRALLSKGNVVTGGLSQGTILTTIVSTDKIYAYFDVNEQVFDYYLKQMREGRLNKTEAGVQVFLALQGEKDYPHKGVIDFAGNRFSPSTGSLQLRAIVDKPPPEMEGGRQIRARIPISNPYDALLVPEDAIQTDQGAKFVFVVDAENKVRVKKIKIGPMAYGLRVVAEGLKKDDLVIIKGLQRARDGEEVKPKDSKEGIKPVKPAEAKEAKQ
jgi:RND family efflux transporter MFP subunit